MNEIIPIGPVSPLRQRLIEDMTMRRFGPETQRNYQRDVGRFATWLGRSPHTATAEDVRRFQIEQREAGVPAPTMNSIVAALRFLFTHTLDRPDLARKLVRTARPHRNRAAGDGDVCLSSFQEQLSHRQNQTTHPPTAALSLQNQTCCSQTRPLIATVSRRPDQPRSENPIAHLMRPAGSGTVDFPTPLGVRNSKR